MTKNGKVLETKEELAGVDGTDEYISIEASGSFVVSHISTHQVVQHWSGVGFVKPEGIAVSLHMVSS